MSDPDAPLQLPPKPVARSRRWPRRTAGIVLLTGTLVAALLVAQDFSKPAPTTVTAASTSTTRSIETATTLTGNPPPPVETRVKDRVLEAAPTTTIPDEEVPASRPGTPELIVKLDALVVDDEHPDGFDPTAFGGYKDADGNGCNTRNEVLIAQSTVPVERSGVCHIVSGNWVSPYDGVVLTDPYDVSIDHGVTIREAWESGAWHWTDSQRNAYVNDLNHAFSLKAVSRDIKEVKADQDPSAWTPPLQTYVCDYLRAWVDVKTAWKLTVDPGEREAIAVKAINCP